MTSALKLKQGRFGRVALLDSDQDLVPHTHPQCHVLIKAHGADTEFEVRGERHALTRESMVLVNAWEPHAKVHRPESGTSTVLALYIEPDWLAGHDRGLGVAGLHGFFPRSCVAMPAHIRMHADRLIACMFEPAQGEAEQARWEAALSELMMAVIHGCSAWRERAALTRTSLRRLSDPRINQAIRYMREHLDTRLSFDALARECHLSRPHFFHLFKTCTAVSPAMYVNTLRMESAFGKLPGGATINDLAGLLGFSEPQHFTRFFRNNLGIPPSEYRRRVELLR
ncbi:MAG: helix-turn-helix domain-containing protein [Rhodospirillaceae bacterium]